MRKIIAAALIVTLSSSNAFAWGYGRGWSYGPGGGCWTNCGYGGASGPAVLAATAGVAVVGGILGGLFSRPAPPPMPMPPPGARIGNGVPGCIQERVVDPTGRVGVNVICP